MKVAWPPFSTTERAQRPARAPWRRVARGNCVLAAGAVKRGGSTDIRQAGAANATGRGWCGRTVIAINTPAMPIPDDAT